MMHIEMVYDVNNVGNEFNVVKLEAVTTVGNVMHNTPVPFVLDPAEVITVMQAVRSLQQMVSQQNAFNAQIAQQQLAGIVGQQAANIGTTPTATPMPNGNYGKAMKGISRP